MIVCHNCSGCQSKQSPRTVHKQLLFGWFWHFEMRNKIQDRYYFPSCSWIRIRRKVWRIFKLEVMEALIPLTLSCCDSVLYHGQFKRKSSKRKIRNLSNCHLLLKGDSSDVSNEIWWKTFLLCSKASRERAQFKCIFIFIFLFLLTPLTY